MDSYQKSPNSKDGGKSDKSGKNLRGTIKSLLIAENKRNFGNDNSYIKKVKNHNNMKYIIFCGSTMSGLGKGSTMSALGFLLQCCGLKVTCIKIDPYLNADAGTMSPFEHGEVFVLDDGGETDLDLGNYERTLNLRLTKNHNITSGKVLSGVINEERKGDYLGKTVQMVPHVTNKIKTMILETSLIPVQKDSEEIADVCLIEIGGTVGDLESSIYFEAIRQFMHERESSDCALVGITYVPVIQKTNEFKTKPAQHGIKELKSLGVYPNILACRSGNKLDKETVQKIAFFADLSPINIINCYDIDSYWDLPLILAGQNFHLKLLDILKLDLKKYQMNKVSGLSQHIRDLESATEVTIAICGKYTKMSDAYHSLNKSLFDASINAYRKIKIEWLDCTIFESNHDADEDINMQREEFWKSLEKCHGIVVPGGFGTRGHAAMIKVCQYARENQIPFLGICLGMQIAVIEFCRNVLNITQATSKEFDETTKFDVITKMDDTSYKELGGTLRLGSKKTVIHNKESLAFKIYGKDIIEERHRHRYEINPSYIEDIEKFGMIFSGKDPDKIRMNFLEIPSHPFFFACQSHPEYKTNPLNPSPIFMALVLCASKQYSKFNEYKNTRKIGLEFIDFDFLKNKNFQKGGIYDDLIKQIIEDSEIIMKNLEN